MNRQRDLTCTPYTTIISIEAQSAPFLIGSLNVLPYKIFAIQPDLSIFKSLPEPSYFSPKDDVTKNCRGETVDEKPPNLVVKLRGKTEVNERTLENTRGEAGLDNKQRERGEWTVY